MLIAISPARLGEQGDAIFKTAQNWLRGFGHPVLTQVAPARWALASGTRVSLAPGALLHGWIDNRAELAHALGLPADIGAAALYGEAYKAWGEAADSHVVGSYAAVVLQEGGTLRLARSAWSAPPLSYARWQGRILVASLPEALFQLGVPREIDPAAIIDQLALAHDPRADLSPFTHIDRVATGSAVVLSNEGATLARWYDGSAIAAVRFARDEDYVERAEDLLGEAARKATEGSAKPAIALSGGLDSPIVAHEVQRCLAPGAKLAAITFRPDAEYRGADLPGTMTDEWPVVERFLAMHPLIEGHIAETGHGGIDHRFREITQLAGTFNAGLALFGAHHGVWETARALGCTDLFAADLGNATFSNDGRWAAAESFGSLRWGRMLSLLRGLRHDPRSLARKFAALALLPQLPRGVRHRLQAAVHRERRDSLGWNTMLSATGREAFRVRARGSGAWPVLEGFAPPRSRADAIRLEIDASRSEMAEITLALELRYGVRYRDVSAYRPLVEYCLGLPTDQFARPGQDRFLARRLARGRLPEEQWRAVRHGRHNADWLIHLKRHRQRHLGQVEAMRAHGWLREVLDLDRMERMLHALPETAGPDERAALPYLQGIGRALLAGQFVGIMEGRNDF